MHKTVCDVVGCGAELERDKEDAAFSVSFYVPYRFDEDLEKSKPSTAFEKVFRDMSLDLCYTHACEVLDYANKLKK